MPAVMITEVDESIAVPKDHAKTVTKKPSDDTVVVGGEQEEEPPAKQTGWVPSNPITLKRVQEICVKNGFYKTPSCNDKLYLHHKGWDKIAELELYTDCKVLWLEGNCIQTIEGLESMRSTLKSLYLHENMLTTLEGVNIFEELDGLNVSDNHIRTLNGLYQNAASDAESTTDAGFKTEEFAEEREQEEAVAAAKAEALAASKPVGGKLFATLNTLQIKNNQLKEVADIQALVEFSRLSVLDLTGNRLEDGEGVLNVLEKMPNLRSLKLSGNPCVRKMTQYRRTVLSRCTSLMHLDDRPVFEDERRTVTAFTEGGAEGEKAERAKIRQEEKDKVTKRLDEFKQMCLDAGARQDQVDGGVGVEDEDDDNSSSSSSDDDEVAVDTEQVAPASAATAPATTTMGVEILTTEVTVKASSGENKHVDPALEASRENSEDREVLVEREVAAPSSSSENSSSPNSAPAGANSKYAKIWEMATAVSDAKEAAEKEGGAADDNDEDAWTPE